MVFVRASPIMETLTGIMIAVLIYYSGKLIMSDEININNFFSFLAAMMLAYQPVRSLATLNLTIHQGISAANRILPIIGYAALISLVFFVMPENPDEISTSMELVDGFRVVAFLTGTVFWFTLALFLGVFWQKTNPDLSNT